MPVVTHGWSNVEARILRRLNGLGDQAMQRALTRVGQDVVGQYRENISQGRSPAGKFRALSPEYAKRKLKRWGQRPILVASGSMLESLGYRVQQLGPSHWRCECGAGGVDAEGVSNGVKALAHIDGTDRIPVRNFGRVPKALLRISLTNALRVELERAAPAPAMAA